MSRLLLTSDLHLGHKAIVKYRSQFSSSEEHHEIVYDNLASSLNKRDCIYFLGDIAFDHYWLNKIKELKCATKVLIVGNHDTDKKVKMKDLVDTYDKVEGLVSKRNCWFTHCPIHPKEVRGKDYVIHGHTHQKLIPDTRYISVCIEHTDYKPITFERAISEEYRAYLTQEATRQVMEGLL